MPSLNDITVHVVTGKENVPLQEWGVQHIRSKKKMSAYIQAETDVSFKILIQPKIPYIASDTSTAHDHPMSQGAQARGRSEDQGGFFKVEDERESHKHRNGVHRRYNRNRPTHDLDKSYGHRRSNSHHSSGTIIKHESDDESIFFSSPVSSTKKPTPPPPFHFLAYLYLDGRTRAERKTIVYLDPREEEFNHPNGEVMMKTRWIQGNDGSLKEHAWVFKDVGIETMFDKLLINGNMDTAVAIAENQEDALAAAMDTTSLNHEIDAAREDNSKVGQIVVEIQRIKLGSKWVEPNYIAKHKEGEMEDVDMNEVNNEITHTAGFRHSRTMPTNPIRVVSCNEYREGEGTYATFQFFYRSKEKLAKFHFAGFNSPTHTSILRSGAADFYQKTPLSIMYRSRPVSKYNRKKGEAFEDKVGKRYVLRNTAAEYRFEDGHKKTDIQIKEEEPASPGRELNRNKSFVPDLLFRSRSRDRSLGDDLKAKAGQIDWPHLRYLLDASSLATTEQSTSSILTSNSIPTLPGSVISLGVSGPTIFTSPSSETAEISKKCLEYFKSAGNKVEISNLVLRDPNVPSDADDEYDPADLQFHAGSDTDKGCGEVERELTCRDQDDQGLSTKVGQLGLGKRGRDRSRENRIDGEHSEAKASKTDIVNSAPTADDAEQLRVKRSRKSSEAT